MTLSDDIILLRPFKLSDAEEHLAGEDEAQQKWLSGGVSTPETVAKFIKDGEEFWKKGGPRFPLAIIEKSTNTLVGMVEGNTDYENLDGVEKGEANISYGIYPAFRGKGFATRAVLLMCEFLKEKGIAKAAISVNPANTASLKVPERCGFTKSGEVITKDGEVHILFHKSLT